MGTPYVRPQDSAASARARNDVGVEIRLLGPFEIVDDGTVAALPRLPRTMLAALVLRANQVVPADTLVEAIWDGEAPDTAASVLRSYVTAARRALPEARLLTHPSGYQLVVEPGEVDAGRFEHLLADGRRALADGHARLARALCQRGLTLWHGPALLDLASHPFARDEGARLDELRLACLETRLDAELRLGRQADALPELERLVAEHPLRERLRALLVLALYRSGRQADALACLADGRRVLVDELGLEPGPELRDLQARILAHDPSLAPPAQEEAPPPSVPAPPTATIGRDAALAAVRRELLERGGRLVTLVGPGGIGKTRLALETARALGPELADGAVFVDASTLSAPDQLLPAIARTLGLREGGVLGRPAGRAPRRPRAAAGARQPRAPGGRRRPALAPARGRSAHHPAGHQPPAAAARCRAGRRGAAARPCSGPRAARGPGRERRRRPPRQTGSRPSASGSTGCRWRSSSPLRGCGRCRRPSCSSGSSGGSR